MKATNLVVARSARNRPSGGGGQKPYAFDPAKVACFGLYLEELTGVDKKYCFCPPWGVGLFRGHGCYWHGRMMNRVLRGRLFFSGDKMKSPLPARQVLEGHQKSWESLVCAAGLLHGPIRLPLSRELTDRTFRVPARCIGEFTAG